MFSGPLPKTIGELLPTLTFLDLSSNSITGRIPHSIGMLQKLRVLNLGNNYLIVWKTPSSMGGFEVVICVGFSNQQYIWQLSKFNAIF
jgi:hypothetical protein